MARNLKNRIKASDGQEARHVLVSLVVYLEALERLYGLSTTLPESTKLTATLTLDEIDYLLGVYFSDADLKRLPE